MTSKIYFLASYLCKHTTTKKRTLLNTKLKLLLDIAMAKSRQLSTEEVAALLFLDDPEGLDDPEEVLVEGSDEEFDDLDEIEEGTFQCSMLYCLHYGTMCLQSWRMQTRTLQSWT